jgi:hypothetical protein
MKPGRVLASIAGFAAVGALLMWAPSPATAASPIAPGPVPITHGTVTVLGSNSATARRIAPGTSPAAQAAVSPPSSCYQHVHLSMNWEWVNGVLATTTADGTSDVSCPALSGQTMQSLSTQTYLVHNSATVANVPTSSSPCTYKGTDPCTYASGGLFWTCGGVACSGYYFANAVATMTLPTGWVWSTWGSGCTPLVGNRTLICRVWTNTAIYVAPAAP